MQRGKDGDDSVNGLHVNGVYVLDIGNVRVSGSAIVDPTQRDQAGPIGIELARAGVEHLERMSREPRLDVLTPTPEPANPLTSSSAAAVADGFVQAAADADGEAMSRYFASDREPAFAPEDAPWSNIFQCLRVDYQIVDRRGVIFGVDVADVSFIFAANCAERKREEGDEATYSNQVIVHLEHSTGYWYVESWAIE